jgi:lysophospholipase L1-like esterase
MRSEGGGSPFAGRVRRAVRATIIGAVLAGAMGLSDAHPVAADYTGPADGARVAVVGDSQVAIATFGGHMVPAHNDRGLQVDSRGHVGRTIAQGRAEIDRVIVSEPDVMVVAFGTNDAYFLGATSGTTADRNHAAARDQIEQVMTQIGQRPCAIWVTPRSSVTNRAHSRWAATVADDIKAAARRHRVRVVDWEAISAGRPEWFIADGVHFTREGSRGFADAVATEAARCMADITALRRTWSSVAVLGHTECRRGVPTRVDPSQPVKCAARSFKAVERIGFAFQ